MIKQLIYPFYRLFHDFLFATRRWNPLFPNIHAGIPVGVGHISDEHLQNPQLDLDLKSAFLQKNITVNSYSIDKVAYKAYLTEANYPMDYYGGGIDPEDNFTEKTLEHFVSLQFLNLDKESTFVDIAACTSPFHRIVKDLYQVKASYQQDLIYPAGIKGEKIGGWAHQLCLPDQSVDGVSLHCSLEHFEGDSDTLFFHELERVLVPGGRAIILPFYLAHTHSNHIDPAYNLLKNHKVAPDINATLRYCSWHQFFSRHYDPDALERRVLEQAPGLSLSLYQVKNFREIHPDSYLRWVGVFEKK